MPVSYRYDANLLEDHCLNRDFDRFFSLRCLSCFVIGDVEAT